MYIATMEAARIDYLPNDAPWLKYKNFEVLQRQCTARSIQAIVADEGALQFILRRFSADNPPSEPRPERWRVKPLEPHYSNILNQAQAGKFWLIKIRDVTSQVQSGGRVKKMAFSIVEDDVAEPFIVTFCNRPTCTCNNYLVCQFFSLSCLCQCLTVRGSSLTKHLAALSMCSHCVFVTFSYPLPITIATDTGLQTFYDMC